MISKERVEELEYYFWNESNDEGTQEWREDLNEEESRLVDEWDKKANKGMKALFEEIIKQKKTYEEFRHYCETELQSSHYYFNFEFNYFEKQYICRYEKYKNKEDGVIVGRYSYDVDHNKEVQQREFHISASQLERLKKL